MFNYDFLVIGSGIAGLVYAIEVSKHGSVAVICKSDPTEGSTRYAQGGIASVTSPLDSFEAHIADTIESGAGLCNFQVVRSVISEGPERIVDLIRYGANFDRHSTNGNYSLAQEGGHSARRILHSGDATGAEVQRALFDYASKTSNIIFFPDHIAIDLIVRDNEVLGSYCLNLLKSEVLTFTAKSTMLATGGAGKVYLYTSNPDVSTGDGIAMAYRARCRIANMEFIQFHPTCLYHPKAKSFLITEAMRGEGAKLLNKEGKEFMHLYHPLKELAPRDIVARAIDDQMKKSGSDHVFLNVSHLNKDFIQSRFPNIYLKTLELGFDITKDPIPVVPAAHYCCGGVFSGLNGETDLKRLYVAGETAMTGLHGANRLASNSLLEALVFAHRAAQKTILHLSELTSPSKVREWDYLDTVNSSEEVLVSHNWDEVRRLMWNLVGIVRSDKRLKLAKKRLEQIKQEVREYYWHFRVTKDLIELRNILQVAEIIVDSALTRRESRGLHYNIDCPNRDDTNWAHDTILKRNE